MSSYSSFVIKYDLESCLLVIVTLFIFLSLITRIKAFMRLILNYATFSYINIMNINPNRESIVQEIYF